MNTPGALVRTEETMAPKRKAAKTEKKAAPKKRAKPDVTESPSEAEPAEPNPSPATSKVRCSLCPQNQTADTLMARSG